MTLSQDFTPGNDGQGESAYPTAFGITFTPTVTGAILAALGLLGAAYLAVNYVLPKWDEYNQLKTQVADTKSQVEQQQQLQQKIDAAQVKLDQAKQQKNTVVSLLGSERPLDTLLLDLNRLIQVRRGQLTKFEPVQPTAAATDVGPPDIVNDSSLGPELNGKLKRKVFNVELQGTFDQVQSTLRSLERLPSLLVVKDLKAEIGQGEDAQKFTVNPQNKVVTIGIPTLTTSFKLHALTPLSEEEAKAAAQPAQPAQQ